MPICPPADHACPPAAETGVTQSRAERKQRRNFAAEAGETGGVYGEDVDEGTPPPGGKQQRPPMPPQTLEVRRQPKAWLHDES
jgi:hypothetical protein